MGVAGAPIKALLFDVFGTVVDWRGSILREVAGLAPTYGWSLDPGVFADRWRGGYLPALEEVRSGRLGWTKLDDLHRRILDGLLQSQGLRGPGEPELDHLNRIWHRLDPWPDAVEGLTRLRKDRTVSALSNGNMALLVNLANHGRLPWDGIFSSELFRRYKPDPELYRGACELLALPPEQVLMVAAHPDDLKAARGCGLATAFVHRPLEWGPGGSEAPPRDGTFDVHARDFLDLARQLAP